MHTIHLTHVRGHVAVWTNTIIPWVECVTQSVVVPQSARRQAKQSKVSVRFALLYCAAGLPCTLEFIHTFIALSLNVLVHDIVWYKVTNILKLVIEKVVSSAVNTKPTIVTGASMGPDGALLVIR